MRSYCSTGLKGFKLLTVWLPALGFMLTSSLYAKDDVVYRLSPFDKISISVYGEADLSTQQLISDNGVAFMPLLGQVEVGGRTVSEASVLIEKSLIEQEYLRKPIVTISIEQFAPKVVTILGEVENPGSVEVPPGKNGISLPVAVAGAGGFSGAAKLNEVRIRRPNPDDPTKPLDLVINLTKILETSSPEESTESMLILADDIVFVPRRLF